MAVGLVGLALGPGGVFYFLVKKGLNGSVEAIDRMEKQTSKISAIQNMDHDQITTMSANLSTLAKEFSRTQRKTDLHETQLASMRARCDLLHREIQKKEDK